MNMLSFLRNSAVWISCVGAAGSLSTLSAGVGSEAQAPAELPRHAIVFAHHSDAERKDYDIWRIAPDGSQMASLVVLPDHQAQFAISPDGNQLVYVSRIEGNGELWRRDFLGGSPQNITNHPANDFAPEWSPDGKELAFFSDRDSDKPELYILQLEKGDITRMTENGMYDSDSSWSPDGNRIIFSRFFPAADGDKSGGHGAIFELDLATRTERQLTDLGGYCGGVDYSPDGQQVAFHRVSGGRSEIWLMEADGSNQRAITETFLDEYSPAWSPDGQWIVYTAGTEHDGRGTFDLWLMRSDGTDRRLISTAPNTQMSPRWRTGEHYCR